jgi:hypothetical protein
MHETLNAFKNSWQSAQGSDFASRMARKSLEAVAAQRPDLNALLIDLKKPLQESLDLHLDGEGVKGHAADTSALGTFMVQVSEVVKQIAKSISGRQRWSHNLLSTAPAPGSVLLHFAVPPLTAIQSEVADTQVASFDAQALRAMANLLVQAESELETLDAATQSLSPPARIAVKHLAETVVESQWRFSGKLEARGRETVELSLSEAGAQRLLTAARRTDTHVREATIRGECDGWTWSTGTLKFLPVGGRPFTASVPPALQGEVARYVSDEGTPVTAVFLVTKYFAAGTARTIRTSYALVDIRSESDGPSRP